MFDAYAYVLGTFYLNVLYVKNIARERDRQIERKRVEGGSKYKRHSTEEFENTEEDTLLLFMTKLETQKNYIRLV